MWLKKRPVGYRFRLVGVERTGQQCAAASNAAERGFDPASVSIPIQRSFKTRIASCCACAESAVAGAAGCSCPFELVFDFGFIGDLPYRLLFDSGSRIARAKAQTSRPA